MTQSLNIARPYAQAAFDLAKESNELPAWDQLLSFVGTVMNDAQLKRIFKHPRLEREKAWQLFSSLISLKLSKNQEMFLKTLVQFKRLHVLPVIAQLFHDYYAQYEKRMDVQITTAVELNPDAAQKISEAIAKRLQKKVTLQPNIDPSIIGGAIIHMGDEVLDASIRGKLVRLLEFSLR